MVNFFKAYFAKPIHSFLTDKNYRDSFSIHPFKLRSGFGVLFDIIFCKRYTFLFKISLCLPAVTTPTCGVHYDFLTGIKNRRIVTIALVRIYSYINGFRLMLDWRLIREVYSTIFFGPSVYF